MSEGSSIIFKRAFAEFMFNLSTSSITVNLGILFKGTELNLFLILH